MRTPTGNSAKGRCLILATVTVAVGLAAGLGGMVLGLLLHFVQHVAYGYSLHTIVSNESFLEGVSASSPLRRFVVLSVCGAVAGTGWWALYRFGSPLISIRKAVEDRNSRMGSSWFSTEDGKKGALAPGRLADLAVLSADYFSIPEDEIKHLESVLTIVDGKVVYAIEEFSKLAPPVLPVSPSWSPVKEFGGYAKQPTQPVAASHSASCSHDE